MTWSTTLGEALPTMNAGAEPRQYGMGRGKVFPASSAGSLLNPLRRIVQSPRRVAAASGIRPGHRVLEVGSGPGFFSPSLRDAAFGGLLVALDLQPEMARLAQERLTGRETSAVVSADAMALPFPAGTFDVVFVAVMLGEVPDVERAVRELRRVLVPGGTASFSETRRDGDFLSLPHLKRLVEPGGFELRNRRGPRWQYVATFDATKSENR